MEEIAMAISSLLKEFLGFAGEASADMVFFAVIRKIFRFMASEEGATTRKHIYRRLPFGIGSGDELAFIAALVNAFLDNKGKAYAFAQYLMRQNKQDRENFIIFIADLATHEDCTTDKDGKSCKITRDDASNFLKLLDAQATDYDRDVICKAAGIFGRPTFGEHMKLMADIAKRKLAPASDWLEKNFPESKPKKIHRFLPW
jgi:hypothetical protein